MTEWFSGGAVGPVTSEQEGSDSSTAPLGAEKLQFFLPPPTAGDPGQGAENEPPGCTQPSISLAAEAYPSENAWLHIPLALDPEFENGSFVLHKKILTPLTLRLCTTWLHPDVLSITQKDITGQRSTCGNKNAFFWAFIYKDLTRSSRKSEVNNRKWPKDLERRVIKWIIFTPPGITGKLSCFGHAEASAV